MQPPFYSSIKIIPGSRTSPVFGGRSGALAPSFAQLYIHPGRRMCPKAVTGGDAGPMKWEPMEASITSPHSPEI